MSITETAEQSDRFAEVENKYRDELRRKDGYIADLEEQLKVALAGKVPEGKPADASTIWVESIISNRTKEGLVNIRWGNMSAQLSVKEARDHAIGILEAAEAATTDALLYDYFLNKLHSSPEMFAGFLADFRAAREARKQ